MSERDEPLSQPEKVVPPREAKKGEPNASEGSKQKSPQGLIDEAQELLAQKHSPLYKYLKDLPAEERAKLDLNHDGALDREELSKLQLSGKSSAIGEKLKTDGGLHFDISRMAKGDGIGISDKDVNELGGRELDHLMLKDGAKALLKHLARADEQTIDKDGNLIKRDGKLSNGEIKDLLEWTDLGKDERASIMVALNHFERQARLAGKDPNNLVITEEALKKAIEYEPKLPSLSLDGLDKDKAAATKNPQDQPQLSGHVVDQPAKIISETKEKPPESIEQALSRVLLPYQDTRGLPALIEKVAVITKQEEADKIIAEISQLKKRMESEGYPGNKGDHAFIIKCLNNDEKTYADWKNVKNDLKQLDRADLSGDLIHFRELSDADFNGFKLMPNLESLSLYSTKFSGAQLAKLTVLPELARLNMGFTDLSDADLAQLPRIPHLRFLGLSNTLVTDSGLDQLARYHTLQELNVGGRAVTRDGLAHVAQLTNLRELNLHQSERCGAGTCYQARLAGTPSTLPEIGANELVNLAPLVNLKSLSIKGPKIKGPDLDQLTRLPSLSELTLASPTITDADVAILKQKFKEAGREINVVIEQYKD